MSYLCWALPVKPTTKTKSLVKSFYFAVTGLAYALRTQRNMKIHLAAALCTVGFGFWYAVSSVEWLILAVTIMAVIVSELMNTALEAVVDLASPGIHPLAKTAKDVAAGAVLISAISAVIIGCIIFYPKIFR